MERLDKLLAATGQWSRKEAKALVKAGRVQVGGARPQGTGGQGGRRHPRHSGWPAHCHGAGGLCDAPQARGGGLLHPGPPGADGAGPAAPASAAAGAVSRGAAGQGHRGPAPPHRRWTWATTCSPRTSMWTRCTTPRWTGRWMRPTRRLAQGMVLGDGLHCLPAELEPLGDGSQCHVTLREGKYHQVKRMLAACGKPVTYLKRLSMGPLRLDEALAPGPSDP